MVMVRASDAPRGQGECPVTADRYSSDNPVQALNRRTSSESKIRTEALSAPTARVNPCTAAR